MKRALLIGSSGRIGTKLREEFNRNSDGVEIILSTSKKSTAEKWKSEGKNAVVLDLNNHKTFIDRLFLLTGYSSDMLFQGKMLIDAAKGVFTSMCGDAPQGWACTKDIAEVSATVLREGPEKHNGKDYYNYYISIDVLRASEVASILSQVSGKEIKYSDVSKEQQEEMFKQISSIAVRNYMTSAVIVMQLTREGKFKAQTAVADDVFTVTGHKGTTMREWAESYCNEKNF